MQLADEKAQLEAEAGRAGTDFEAATAEMAALKERQAELKAELVRPASFSQTLGNPVTLPCASWEAAIRPSKRYPHCHTNYS
jgi:hypothetical protein